MIEKIKGVGDLLENNKFLIELMKKDQNGLFFETTLKKYHYVLCDSQEIYGSSLKGQFKELDKTFWHEFFELVKRDNDKLLSFIIKNTNLTFRSDVKSHFFKLAIQNNSEKIIQNIICKMIKPINQNESFDNKKLEFNISNYLQEIVETNNDNIINIFKPLINYDKAILMTLRDEKTIDFYLNEKMKSSIVIDKKETIKTELKNYIYARVSLNYQKNGFNEWEKEFQFINNHQEVLKYTQPFYMKYLLLTELIRVNQKNQASSDLVKVISQLAIEDENFLNNTKYLVKKSDVLKDLREKVMLKEKLSTKLENKDLYKTRNKI